jgi:hypothetical protein
VDTDGAPGRELVPVPGADPGLSVDEIVTRSLQVGFGAAALAAELLVRAAWRVAPGAVNGSGGLEPAEPAPDVAAAVDALLGTAWSAVRVSGRMAGTAARIASPVLRALARPPLVPDVLSPAAALSRSTESWRRDRPGAVDALSAWSASVAADGLDIGLGMVDLDALVLAVLARIDVDAVVRQAIDEVDLDARTEQVLASLDLDEVAESLVGRLNISGVVEQAVSQIDLTSVVLEHVDLRQVITAALDSIDLNQVVQDRVDMAGLAEYVVEAIDLPDIVRESSGLLANESVRGLRMQGIDADQAISRAIDRVLRRRGRATLAPAQDDPGPKTDTP